MTGSHDHCGKPELSKRGLNTLIELTSQPRYSGMIEASVARELALIEEKPIEDLMVALLPNAASRAFVPLSHYHVGAVCLGKSGNLYFGSNIEIPGQPLGYAVHGEQSAFGNAFVHGEREFRALAVNAPPCGHCRQFMSEIFGESDFTIIIEGIVETSLGQLLPESFGPSHLGISGGFAGWPHAKLSVQETFEAFQAPTDLTEAALAAAINSYCPYSNSPSGAAISTTRDRVYRGSYIENAAYNPSLPPIQAALNSLIQSGDSPDGIVDCVLVELRGAAITQLDVAQSVIRALHPAAKFEVVYAQRMEG
ncbi:MAG: cytidine deaminase [Candidatus Obscuribacterales bacterium]|nr:cytidine deaminase [Candidatus Obscuribacterales bacterium]